MSDPQRLLDAGADAFEARLLASASVDNLDETRRQRLKLGLGVGVAAGITAVAGAASSTTTSASAGGGAKLGLAVTAKWIGALAVAGVVGVGGYRIARPSRPDSVAPVQMDPRPTTVPPIAPIDPPAPVVAPPLEASPPANPSPTAIPTPRPRTPGLAAETASLDRARALLQAGDTSAALHDLLDHQRRFARGHMHAEAEVLSIEALVRAGSTSEAQRRATVFLRREPHSPYRVRIEALLAR